MSFINEAYVWLYENLEDERTFNATFNFELDNLELEDEDKGKTSWEVTVRPGKKIIKRIKRKNATGQSKYKSSYSYSIYL